MRVFCCMLVLMAILSPASTAEYLSRAEQSPAPTTRGAQASVDVCLSWAEQSPAPTAGFVRARANVYLRVVGADDTWAAQAEKLRVRDAILRELPGDARLLPAALPKVMAAANAVAPCAAQIVLYSPDQKTPGRLTLLIGVREARGHNWFGLLYTDSYALFASGEGERTFCFPFWEWLLTTTRFRR